MAAKASLSARSRAREVSLSAVVVRADGTREPLGTISYWHKNPLMRLLWRLKQWALS